MYTYHTAPEDRRKFCDYVMMQQPKSVALVALGPSSREFFIEGAVLEGFELQTDEVWAINGGMIAFRHDRVFNMHDLRRTAKRVPRLGQAMMVHDRPILCPIPYPEFPTSYAYPLSEVIQATGENYLNSTVAYAIAYAVSLKVKDIWLYGCDFWYPDLQRREQGGQCAAYWLGQLRAFGIHYHLPQNSSLLDALEVREYSNEKGEKFSRRPYYGYEEGAWREDIGEYAHFGIAQNPRSQGGPGPGLPGNDAHDTYQQPGPKVGGPGAPANLGAGGLPALGGGTFGRGNGSPDMVLGRGGESYPQGVQGDGSGQVA
jgi:hypothetical protein